MPPGAEVAYRELVSAPSKGAALTRFMDAWLDGGSFDLLREFLQNAAAEKKMTADELRAISLAWSRLDRDEEAIAAVRRASELDSGGDVWLERARLEARMQLFKDALASLEKVGSNADAAPVMEAAELRWSIVRHQGGDELALAKLRALAEARPDDVALRLQVARWEVERGNRDRVLPFLRQRVAEEKDAAMRERWRLVLVDALHNQGLSDEAVRIALDGALAAKEGSEAEEEFVSEIVSAFRQRRFESAVNPSPADVATALSKRPAALLALVEVMLARGENAAAVEAIGRLAKELPDHTAVQLAWAHALADAERYDEVIAVLKARVQGKPEDAAALVRLAMILRESGREADGAKVLEDWAVTPQPDEARIRKVAALLPLFLPANQAKAWSDAALKGLPKREPVEIRKGAPVESVPPEIRQIEESGDDAAKRIGRLIELRGRLPKSDAVALALVKAFVTTGREPEAWQVMISRHAGCETPEDTRKWWRGVLSLEQSGIALRSRPALSRLQELRRELGGSANYWIAIAELAMLSGDIASRIAALTEAVRLASADAELRLALADALADSGAVAEARRAVAPLFNGASAAKARLFLVGLELNHGRIEAAERALAEVIDDGASDAREIEEIAVRLMGWHQWRTAAALLAAQRVVHPKDYRLACLHGIALQESGARDEAIGVFLGMGAFRDEVDEDPARKLLLRRYFGGVPPSGVKNTDAMSAWMEIVRAVQVGLNYRTMMSATISERRSRGMEQLMFLAPMQVTECGARAMAYLLDLARDMTAAEKAALVERARAAGLSLPDALLIGRLEPQDQTTTLVIDDDAVRARLAEPAMAQLWLASRLFPRAAAKPDQKKEADDSALARQCVSTLLPDNAVAALNAALVWWKSEADSPDAFAAVVKCIGLCDGDAAVTTAGLTETLMALPPEIRREAKHVEALSRALHGWLERVRTKRAEAAIQSARSITPCFFAMARWNDAAALLDEAAGFAATLKPAQTQTRRDEQDEYRRGNPMPPWMYLQASSPLVWPLGNVVADHYYLGGMFPQAAASRGRAGGVAEEDRAAFLAAGKGIKDRQLRLSWLLAGRDEQGMISEVRAWVKAEPASINAVLLAACVAAHDKNAGGALDMLHGLIAAQKDDANRRTAQLLYLRAVLFAPGQEPFNSEGRIVPRAPPKAQQRKVAAILRELHPALVPFKTQIGDGWSAAFAVSGLEKEAAALAVNREQRQRSPGPWLQGERDFFERSNERRNRRRFDERVAPHHIERFVKDFPRDRVVAVCLTALRREADERYLAEMQRGENIEDWRRAVSAQNLSADLMKAADPGARRTFRRLVQAMHVAAVCGEWNSAVALGGEALKLEPRSRALALALMQSRQRAGGDASDLVKYLTGLPVAEARTRLRSLLSSARSSDDIGQRLKLAAAILKVAAQIPEIVRSEREGSSQIVSETFRLLADPFRVREGEVPPLFPEAGRSVPREERSNPESPEELASRKKLHAELCDLALKNPAWGDEALSDLSLRHLLEGRPDAEVLTAYIRDMAKARPKDGEMILANWLRSVSERRTVPDRLRIARVAFRVLPVLKGNENAELNAGRGHAIDLLAHLIGGRAGGPWPLPLFGLWEYPEDMTGGNRFYAEEQMTLNKERKGILNELWLLAKEDAVWQSRLLPFWAGYRLNYEGGKAEVLELMRKHKDMPGDPYGLRGLLNIAPESFGMESRVATAEITDVLLHESKPLIERTDMPRLVDQVLKLLAGGRAEDSSKPPLDMRPEDAERSAKGVSAALQRRRQAVHASLSGLVSHRIPPTPGSVFIRLERDLRAGRDTASVEKQLKDFAAANPSGVAGELQTFIAKSNGSGAIGERMGGIWDTATRVRWFETALRIGRPLLSDTEGRDEWLRIWLRLLAEANHLVKPEIPPVFGFERESEGEGPPGATATLYAARPLIKERDRLYLEGIALAMKQPRMRDSVFTEFALFKMAQTPPDKEAVLEVCLEWLKQDASRVSSTIEDWLQREAGQNSLNRVLACATVVEKVIAAWPSNATNASTQWLGTAKMVVSSGSWNRRMKAVPLLPGTNFSRVSSETEVSLTTPGVRERHAALVRIVDKAALKPNLARQLFADLARLHVEDAPERVEASARLVMQEEPESLRWAFESIYRDEEIAPLNRRLAWGRLALRMMPLVKRDGMAVLENSPSWLSATMKYLQAERPNYSSLPKVPPPTPEMLRERDDLVAKLTGQMLGTPGLAIESLVPYARKQFESGAAPDAVLALVKKAMDLEANRVNDQLGAWCGALSMAKAEAKERMWAAQVLVPMAELWPVDRNSSNASWMESAGWTLGHGSSTDELPPEQTAMLERLMDAALKHQATGARMIAAYAATKTGRTKAPQRVLDKARTDPAAAAEWMKGWWEPGRRPAQREEQIATGDTALKILQGWPPNAPAETLAWTLAVLQGLGDVDPSGSSSSMFGGGQSPEDKDLVPVAPPDGGRREIAGRILAELVKRNAAFEWITPARLRLAITLEGDDAARKKAVESIFKNNPERDAAADYLRRSLVPAKQDGSQAYLAMRSPNHPASDPKVEKTLDAVRCVRLAADEKWLAAEITAPLLELARARLKEIVARPRLDPRIYPGNMNDVPAAQADAALELLKALAGSSAAIAPATTEKKNAAGMLPELLPARIDDGLRAAGPVPQIAEAAWSAVTSDPVKASEALRKWAAGISQAYRAQAFIASGDLALNLAQRWTAEQPPPDWLVVFVSRWSAGGWLTEPGEQARRANHLAEHRAASAHILPKLVATLKKFPACQDAEYFRVISPQARKPMSGDATEDELVDLALAHIKARTRSFGVGSSRMVLLVPDLPHTRDRSSEQIPLFSDLDRPDAHLFLLEHAWRKGKEQWLRETCRPVIESSRWTTGMDGFDLLTDLYFHEKSRFAQAAEAFGAAIRKDVAGPSGNVKRVLRVAKLRGIDLNAGAWHRITDKASQVTGYSERLSAARTTVAWLAFRHETHAARLGEDLSSYFRAVMGRDFTAKSAVAAMGEEMNRRREARISASPVDVVFQEPRWQWIWDTLKLAVIEPDFYGAVLHAANETGLLAEDSCGERLLREARASSWILSEAGWKRPLETSRLLDSAPMPDRVWLTPVEGLVPLWELGNNIHLSWQRGAAKWLGEETVRQPTVGKALLWLAAQRDRGESVGIGQIEAALLPCRALLKKQPRERLAQLTAALLVVQPRLMEAIAASDDGSILKLLPPPAIEPLVEKVARRWLSDTAVKLPAPEYGSIFQMLAVDLCRLIRARSSQTDAVFDAGVRALAARGWKDKLPAGIAITDWAREEAASKLMETADEYAGSHSSGSRGEYVGPEDDNRRSVAPGVFEFLLRHAGELGGTLVSYRFDRMAERVWSDRMVQVAWDGRAIAREFMAVPGAHPAGAQLLQFAGLQKALTSTPVTSLEQMADEAAKAAASDSRHRAASWICRLLLEREVLRRTGAATTTRPAQPSPALVADAAARWQEAGICPAARLVLTQLSLDSVPAAQAMLLLREWTGIASMRRPVGDRETGDNRYFSGDLRWMSAIKDSAPLRENVIDAATVVIDAMKQSGRSIYLSTSLSGGGLADCILLPLAHQLDALGEHDRRQELLKLSAELNLLPREVLVSELRRDSDKAIQELVPAYFKPIGSTSYRTAPRPAEPAVLTREDEKAIARLHSPGQGKSDRRTALLILSALPDSEDSPPRVNRSARVTAIVQDMLRDPQSDTAAVDEFISQRGVPETLLAELLPLLRQHPFVKQWSVSGMSFQADAQTRLSHQARTLCLWALAEVLHGGQPDAWTKLMADFKQRANDANAAREKQQRGGRGDFFATTSPAYYAVHTYIPWLSEASSALSAVAEWWVDHRPPAEWPRLVQPLIEVASVPGSSLVTGPSFATGPAFATDTSSATARDLSALLHQTQPAFSTQALDAAFAKPKPVVSGRYGDRLWEKLATSGMAPARRWELLAARRSRGGASLSIQDANLLAASRTRLLTSAELAAIVSEVPVETLASQPNALVDWLIAGGHKKEALTLIRRVVEKAPAQISVDTWLVLAVFAHDLGDGALAARALTAASEAKSRSGRPPVEAVTARLKRG